MTRRLLSRLLALACAAGAAATVARAADTIAAASASAPQASWTNARHGFTVQLIQLSPDNVRAFYENMGYPPKAIEAIARVCVFGTAIRNNAGVPISYNVANWKAVTADGKHHALITKSQWLQRWKPLGVTTDWSILPVQQTLHPGDWAQGFTTVDLPRGTRFTLVFFWREHGTRHQATLAGPQCAGTDSAQP